VGTEARNAILRAVVLAVPFIGKIIEVSLPDTILAGRHHNNRSPVDRSRLTMLQRFLHLIQAAIERRADFSHNQIVWTGHAARIESFGNTDGFDKRFIDPTTEYPADSVSRVAYNLNREDPFRAEQSEHFVEMLSHRVTRKTQGSTFKRIGLVVIAFDGGAIGQPREKGLPPTGKSSEIVRLDGRKHQELGRLDNPAVHPHVSLEMIRADARHLAKVIAVMPLQTWFDAIKETSENALKVFRRRLTMRTARDKIVRGINQTTVVFLQPFENLRRGRVAMTVVDNDKGQFTFEQASATA
jgi:hypothetical protein